jgi:hypothetical protein
MQATIREATAIGRIAACLAPLVTGTEIEALAAHFEHRTEGSNKQAKFRALLFALRPNDRRKASDFSSAIATLTLTAHDRFLAGKNEMTEEDVDAVVSDMRQLGLDPGELADKSWRTGFGPRTAPIAPSAVTE